MAKAMIRKRKKPPRKKNDEPGVMERMKMLTDSAPVARFRGGKFVLKKDGEDKISFRPFAPDK